MADNTEIKFVTLDKMDPFDRGDFLETVLIYLMGVYGIKEFAITCEQAVEAERSRVLCGSQLADPNAPIQIKTVPADKGIIV